MNPGCTRWHTHTHTPIHARWKGSVFKASQAWSGNSATLLWQTRSCYHFLFSLSLSLSAQDMSSAPGYWIRCYNMCVSVWVWAWSLRWESYITFSCFLIRHLYSRLLFVLQGCPHQWKVTWFQNHILFYYIVSKENSRSQYRVCQIYQKYQDVLLHVVRLCKNAGQHAFLVILTHNPRYKCRT